MAIGKASDFQIYEDEFYGGMVETLQQNSDAFNGASNNAIRFTTNASEGHFQKEAFFDQISSLVSRRDITATTSATDLAMTSDQLIRPKVNRKVGPVANTLDSLRKIASNQSEFSFLLGQQVGKAKAVDYANTAILCASAALNNVAGVQYDATDGDLAIADLIAGRALFGDAYANIVAWVMHSKPFHDIVGEQATIATDSVAGATIYEGSVGTLGRPTVVIDSSSLVNTDGITSGTDSYYTLGLVQGGVDVQDSEQDNMVSDLITGLENLVIRIQGEHAFNVGVKGFAYNQSTANPADSALGTSSNWTNKMADVKSLAGVVIESQ